MQLIDLPLELLGSICQWLRKDDIRSTRLACRLFNEAASPFLLERAWLSSSSEDQETLTAISLHRTFSNHVKEIYYDGTIYDPELLDVFNNDRSYRKYVRKFLKNKSKIIWPKNAIRYAISQYKARLKEQTELQAYRGSHLTRSSDDPPHNLGSLIEAAKGSYDMVGRLAIDTFDRYLPADLLCLLRALQRMPSVRKFGISDRRWSESRNWWDDCREYAIFCDLNDKSTIIHSGKVRGRQTVQIHPQHWPHNARWQVAREHSKIWYRGFHVLTQALSMLNLKQFRSFTIDSADESISFIVLDMTSTELTHTCNAFRHLTTISLHIDTQKGNPQCNWTKILASGDIALMLNAAKGLKHLDLGFDMAYTEIPELSKLLGPLTWPSLRDLDLRNLVLEEDELVAFLTRHISTLKSICLDSMLLFKHHSPNPESADWTPKSWKGAFRSMSVLALTDLCIFTPISDGRLLSMHDYWHSNDPAKINRFLASGGDAWFAKNELEYDQQQQRQWLEAQRENERLD